MEDDFSSPIITNQCSGEANIDNSHQFEALFDFATIGIVVTNEAGKILNFNKYAEKQFGYTKEEICGQSVEALLPKKIHLTHSKYREEYYTHPEPRIMGHGRDLYAQNKTGGTFPVEVSLSHYVIDGQTFVIAFVIDITVRKKHESNALEQKNEMESVTREIKEMNRELEHKVDDRTKMLREALAELELSKEELNEAYQDEKELSELKSRFVTIASHEFRTPLSTILSSAFLIEKYTEQTPDEKILKHIQRIKGAVGGMRSILEDFLSLGKLEERLVHANIEKANAEALVDLINKLIQEFEGLLKPGQQIMIHNSVNQDVFIDKNLLKKILMNLISNAVKFTYADSIINISSSIEDKNLKICVSDAGIGISEEDQQYLFTRFFRATNALNIQGTGLGLHIVTEYLKLLNGRIEMVSKINEGSAFTIIIPQ